MCLKVRCLCARHYKKRYWFNKELGAGFGNLRKDTFVEYDELFKTSSAHGQRKGNSMFCLVTWAGKTSFVTLYSGQFDNANVDNAKLPIVIEAGLWVGLI